MIDPRTVRRVVVAMVLYWAAAAVLLHVLEPGVDPVAVPMSDYVNTSSGALMTTTYFASALALVGIVIGLRRTLPVKALAGVGLALFSIAALATVIGGGFPGEPPPPQTLSGKIHLACGIVVFPSMGVAIVLCTLAIRKDARWRAAAGWLGWLAVGAATATVLFPVLAPSGAGGLAQRVDFLFVFGWVAAVAYRLPRINGVAVQGRL